MWEKSFFYLLRRPSVFTLLVAPVAWGKTRLIFTLTHFGPCHFVYVSPLRALAEEFFLKAKDHTLAFLLDGVADEQKFHTFLQARQGVLVMTAERLAAPWLRQLQKQQSVLFLFDEFHLFYHWGASFRPKLWECFLDLSQTGHPCLAMTATISEDLLHFCQVQIPLGHNEAYLVNLGNRQLIYPPADTFTYPIWAQRALERSLHYILRTKKSGTVLCFTQFRGEVDKLKKYFSRQGLSVLGCKGGEAQFFVQELQHCPFPDLIVATKTLSHGVNLPPICAVFLAYVEKDQDFWIQMVGRGGRRGERYELYLLGPDYFPRSWKQWWKTWCHHWGLRLRAEFIDSIALLLGQQNHANQGRGPHSSQGLTEGKRPPM